MSKTVFGSTCGSYSLELFAEEKAEDCRGPVPLVAEKNYPLSGTVNLAYKVPKKIREFDGNGNELVFADPKALTYINPETVESEVTVYIHDLQVFYNHRNLLEYARKKLLERNLSRANKLIAISDRVKISAKYVFNLDLDCIDVEYQGVHPERFCGFKEVEGLPDRFVLYVGGLGERKNPGVLDRVNKEIDADLVVASQDEYSFESEVVKVDSPSDSQLSYLYSNADVYLSVSDLEGFSRTPVEASLYDTPVLVHRFTPSKHLIDDELLFEFKSFSSSIIGQKVNELLRESGKEYVNSLRGVEG